LRPADEAWRLSGEIKKNPGSSSYFGVALENQGKQFHSLINEIVHIVCPFFSPCTYPMVLVLGDRSNLVFILSKISLSLQFLILLFLFPRLIPLHPTQVKCLTVSLNVPAMATSASSPASAARAPAER
jgi:hypothetical protein